MESQIWHPPASSATLRPCGRVRNGTMASAHHSVREKVVPQLLPCQTGALSVPPCVHSAFQAGARREWVWVSPCVGSLRGTAWDSRSFYHQLNPHWFCRQMLWGLIFLALEPWARGSGVGLGLLTPEISLLNFYLPHMVVGPAHSMSLSLPRVWMDVVSSIL